jgi:hypothetical protein
MPTSTLFRADVGIRPYNPYTTMSLRTSDPRSLVWQSVLLRAFGSHGSQGAVGDADSHASVRTGSE